MFKFVSKLVNVDAIVKLEVNILDKDYTIPKTMSNLSLNNRVSSEKRNKVDKTLP